MLSLVFLVAIAACNAPLVQGEIKAFSGPLPATSSFVQYSSGYLVDPGYLDLSKIIFTADANEPSKAINKNSIDDDDDGDGDETLTVDDDQVDQTAYVVDTGSPTGSPTSPPTTAATDALDVDEDTNAGTDEDADAEGSEDEDGDTDDADADADADGAVGEDVDTDTDGDMDVQTNGTDTDTDTDDDADADVDKGSEDGDANVEAAEDKVGDADVAAGDDNADKDLDDQALGGDDSADEDEDDTDVAAGDDSTDEDDQASGGDESADEDEDDTDVAAGDDSADEDEDDQASGGDDSADGDEDDADVAAGDDSADEDEDDADVAAGDDSADEDEDDQASGGDDSADGDEDDTDVAAGDDSADEDEDDQASGGDDSTDEDEDDADVAAGDDSADEDEDDQASGGDDSADEDEDDQASGGDDATNGDKDDTDIAAGDDSTDEDEDDTDVAAGDDSTDEDEDDTDVAAGDDSADEDEDNQASSGDDYYGHEFEEKAKAEEEDENDDQRRNRNLASGGGDTVIDLVFFHEPSDCAKTKEGCDWVDLGVGELDRDGRTRWCCSEDAVAERLCTEAQQGRMIIDKDIFDGVHRPILVPGTGDWVGSVEDPKIFTMDGTGQYTMVMANCNDYGRNILVNGEYIWMSKGGFLPGDLFSEFHFLALVTICYAGLLFWYAKSMSTYKDSIIGIQKWILGTIILVLIEMFFKTTDYMLWNSNGYRSSFAMYAWISVGVLKGAISRCVLVMVSLGWGVIRDTLGDGMRNIVILGLLYSFLAFAKDVAAIIFVKEIEILSLETEREIYDVFTVLTFMVAVIDVLFYMWILDGLNATMQYLENMNQSMKLRRFLRLRLILILSIFFGFVWSVFGIVDATMDTALLDEGQEWIIRAAWYVNYGCVLVAIALLWKPDPRAKQFAYVMELPSVGDDMVLDTHIDSMDDDEDGVNVSYSDYRDDGKFTIGNAVSS